MSEEFFEMIAAIAAAKVQVSNLFQRKDGMWQSNLYTHDGRYGNWGSGATISEALERGWAAFQEEFPAKRNDVEDLL